jgi:hypothetical protein
MILVKTKRLQTSSNNLSIIVQKKYEHEHEQIYTMIDKAYYVDEVKYKIE